MFIRYQKILLLVLLMILSVSMGCFSTKERVIRVSLTPPPDQAKGVLYIATEKPIDVAIEGQNEVFSLSCPGWYLIPKEDLIIMLKKLNEIP